MSALTNLVLDKLGTFSTSEEASAFFETPVEEINEWLQGFSPVPVSAVEKVFDLTKLAPKVGEVSWEGRKVCITLPWYKQTNPATAFSVMSLLDRTRMMVMLQFGDAFIAHTRNQLASAFLKSTAEWMLTVDDDMVLPCGNAAWFNSYTGFDLPEQFAGLNTVTRLMSHGKTLVGALYFGRWKSGKPVYGEGNQKAEEKFARSGPHDVVKPKKWVGTGCMLVHRSVFLDIEKTFPHLARNADGNLGNFFTSSEHDLKNGSRELLEVLNDGSILESTRIAKAMKLLTAAEARSAANSSLGMGEDVQFCNRAIQAGHQPHVDMGLICGHQGSFIYGHKKAGWVS